MQRKDYGAHRGTSMVREGYYFGLPSLLFGVAAFALDWTVAGVFLFTLAASMFYFFRDPERVAPVDPAAIVSPADGRVVVVTEEQHNGRAGKRISIFLAIWDVHVNRAPAAGTIAHVEYRPGKFAVAMRQRASLENEQNVISLSTDAGEIVLKQIAGWIARRVVLWKKQGEIVARGERIGLIRFGSRVDVWLPREAEIRVAVGDAVRGGATVLAHWPSQVASGAGSERQGSVETPRMITAGNRM